MGLFCFIFDRLLHEDELRREELGEDGKTTSILLNRIREIHTSCIQPTNADGFPLVVSLHQKLT